MFQILLLTTTKSIDLRIKAIPFGPQLVAKWDGRHTDQ